MELTQLQWQQVWQKFTPVWWQINIWSASWNQIQNAWLPSNAAQVNIQNWSWEIKQMHPSSPVFVNWKQIQNSSPVKYWDTLSVWASNNVVLWVHKWWENLNAQQIWEHLWNLNFSWEQIADLTNKIFNFAWNKAIHKQIFILIWVLSILLFWIIFSYFKLMWVWDQIQKEKKALDWKLTEINSQLSAASTILWKDLVSWDLGDNSPSCDPEVEWCNPWWDNTNSKDNLSLTDQIKNLKDSFNTLKSNISKLKTEQQKAITEMKKVAANPKKEIKKVSEEKIDETKKIIEENQKNIQLMNTNFSKIVEELQAGIKKSNDFQKDFKDNLKSLTEFQIQKNVLKEENQIRDNKIKEAQSDIDKLWKKDDSIDVEIKKLQEEINSLELKIKNLK